ncbi:MAG: hypothetical protein ACYCVE_16445, partial [Gemmatimonadaceae bacterium]
MTTRSIALYLSGLLVCACAGVQRAHQAPERLPAVPVAPESVTVVPLTLDHGFPLVPAKVDGRTGEFLLDAGSPVMFLYSRYVQPGLGSELDTVRTAADHKVSFAPYNIHRYHLGTL